MHPLPAGILILFFVLLGTGGLVTCYYNIRSLRKKTRTAKALTALIAGLLSLGFTGYNFIGYQRIYAENARLMSGTFRSKESDAVLRIYPNNSWAITSPQHTILTKGKWGYVMSEDWCYWNIQSDNHHEHIQTGSPNEVFFPNRHLHFYRVLK